MRLDYPNARGTLSAPLSKSARTVQFNADLEALLVNLLEGDWTYLLVRNDFGGSEVIKLAVELGQRVVYRAQDYTCATAFQQGDTVEYVFTTEHATVQFPSFILYAEGAIIAEENVISYKLPTIEHLGSIEVVSSRNILLGINSQAYGCCGSAGDGALAVEEPYIYLTSRMYPIYMLDYLSSQGARYVRAVLGLSQLEAIATYVLYYQASLIGGYLEHDAGFESMRSYSRYNQGSLYGAKIEYNAKDEKLKSQAIYIQVNLYGDNIVYSHRQEDRLSSYSVYTEASLI